MPHRERPRKLRSDRLISAIPSVGSVSRLAAGRAVQRILGWQCEFSAALEAVPLQFRNLHPRRLEGGSVNRPAAAC